MKIISTFVRKVANDWTMNLASMLTYSLIPGALSILLTVVGPLVSLGILWEIFLSIDKIVPNTLVKSVPNTLVLFAAAARRRVPPDGTSASQP